jgi:hypothetical protein
MAKAYESELTGFLRSLKQSRPQIEGTQREGRALWWDRRPDADEQQRWQASRVRQGAYVYYPQEPVKPGTEA